jgi:hypothetical protein
MSRNSLLKPLFAIVMLALFAAGAEVKGQDTTFPVGNFTITVPSSSVPATLSVAKVAGYIEFFFDDSTYTVSQNGQIVVQGVYTATADQLVVQAMSGPNACATSIKGTYQWTFDGKVLNLTSVDDDCDGRVFLMSHPLTFAFSNGAYSSTMVSGDRSRELGTLSGDWQIEFTGDYYVLLVNGRVQVVGSYVISGDQVTMTDLSGPLSCAKEGNPTATFHWAMPDTQTLTFTAIDDQCEKRATVMSIHPFIKVE